jgi:hypothetical protein
MDRFVPGAHTPTHSITASPAATPEAATKPSVNEKKLKDEYDHVKTRLTDSKFEISRSHFPATFLPDNGTDAKTQKSTRIPFFQEL